MSTQPFSSPRVRFLDSNGAPLSGGLLYTYAAGTTTPLATYTDEPGGTPNTNPVVLDASGYADVWLQPGVNYRFDLEDASNNLQWTVDNYPSPTATNATTLDSIPDPGGRLTLTSGTPVTTADVTNASTIYYVPYKGDKVPLYDGTNWALYSIGTGVSQATSDATKSPAAVAANKTYDLFLWNDAGVVRLSRGPAWPSDTSRGTGAGTSELARVNGRLVNANSVSNGPVANCGLYVGTVHSDVSSLIHDEKIARHCWNAYSRVIREMQFTLAGPWNYALSTLRQANANGAAQLDVVTGLSEDVVTAAVTVVASNDTGSAAFVVGVGVNSSTVSSTDCVGGNLTVVGSTQAVRLIATYAGLPGIGRNTLKWLEAGDPSGGTQQWSSGAIKGLVLA